MRHQETNTEFLVWFKEVKEKTTVAFVPNTEFVVTGPKVTHALLLNYPNNKISLPQKYSPFFPGQLFLCGFFSIP